MSAHRGVAVQPKPLAIFKQQLDAGPSLFNKLLGKFSHSKPTLDPIFIDIIQKSLKLDQHYFLSAFLNIGSESFFIMDRIELLQPLM